MSNVNCPNETKILKGKDVLEQLCDECLALGDKVLIIFSENLIKQTGLYARVVSLLNICGIEHATFECLSGRFTYEEAEKAVELGKCKNVQLLLAIGDDELTCFAKIVAHDFYNDMRGSSFKKEAPKKHLPIINVSSMRITDDQKKITVPSDTNHYAFIKPNILFTDYEY